MVWEWWEDENGNGSSVGCEFGATSCNLQDASAAQLAAIREAAERLPSWARTWVLYVLDHNHVQIWTNDIYDPQTNRLVQADAHHIGPNDPNSYLHLHTTAFENMITILCGRVPQAVEI